MKKTFRALVALTLAVVMCLSLAACGKKTESGTETQVQETPEFAYVSEFEKCISNSKNYIIPGIVTEDGCYAVSSEVIGQREIPEGVVPQYEGEYDIYGSVIFFLNDSGEMEKLPNFETPAPPENTNGYKDFSSSVYIDGLRMDNEGKLVGIEEVFSSWYEGPDNVSRTSDEYWNNQKYVTQDFIVRYDTDGTLLSRNEIFVDENDYLAVYRMQIDANNNVVVNTDTSLRVIGMDGEDVFSIPLEAYPDNLLTLADGRIAVQLWDNRDGKSKLFILDEEKKALDEGHDAQFDTYKAVPGRDGYDLFYLSGSNFYGYKLDTGESTKLFNWIDCDVNANQLGNIAVMDNGDITGFITTWNSGSQTYDIDRVTVKKVPGSSVPNKEIIRMAVMYLDDSVMERVIRYNRRNDKYRISVVDYSEYNTEEDYTAGRTKLNTEIMAGNAPDIFVIDSGYSQLASKGILEDLYPYLDADPELNRADFFPNVLQAVEVNGKLCATVPTFGISTVVGAASLVGDKPGWTYDDLMAAYKQMPDGCTIFDPYVTRDDMLSTCLALDMAEYVDWSTGKCSFDSEEFVKLLEFVTQFPATFDWDNYDYMENGSTYEKMAQGKQMLMQTSMYGVEDMMYNNFEEYIGKATYIGFPTVNGTGNMFNFNSTRFGMSSRSPYKDEIWNFMRDFFTADYQREQWNLPSNRSVFEEKLKEACTVQYQQSTNGDYLLDEKGEKIPIVRYYVWDEKGQVDVPVCALSEEQAAKLTELVETTTKVADYDSSIFDIVNEQAQAFFAGQKSAQEVAKLIQSKANIFINEQR